MNLSFIPYKQWLFENKEPLYDVGCVMLYTNITKENWKKFTGKIDKSDIYNKPGYGLEFTPHVTLLYGIDLKQSEPEDVRKLLNLMKPLTLEIDTISHFSTDDFDVIKLSVPKDKMLLSYREAVETFLPNKQTFSSYIPHITIAYTLPNTHKKYVGKITPFEITFDVAVYSYSDGKKNHKIYVKLINDNES